MRERSTADCVESSFRAHERALWGMLYRLTGSAADSDELVQETFVRLLERPPADLATSLKPWLVRVAMNLGLDALRARRRRAYVGPWLPTPVEIDDTDAVAAFEPVSATGVTTEGRYDLLESVSLAFLVALEALTPRQRAVLLLRDVFDYSVDDTAGALGITTANVKTVHYRARRTMHRYDVRRAPIDDITRSTTRVAVEKFVAGLAMRDLATIEALLTDDAREISDGAGEYLAALRPIEGAHSVARFFLGISGDSSYRYTIEPRTLNGLPALLVTLENPPPRIAPRFALAIDVDEAGRIRDLYTIVAPLKLRHLASRD